MQIKKAPILLNRGFPYASVLFPDFFGDFLNELKLRPLLLLRQFIADFAGGKSALRAQAHISVF